MTLTDSLTRRARAPQTDGQGAPPRRSRGAWARRAPLLPALIFMIVVTQLPFVGTVVISFMRWTALEPDNKAFAGLDNYTEAVTDPQLRSSLLTTVTLTVTVVLISLVLGLGLALLLDRQFRGRGIVRTRGR